MTEPTATNWLDVLRASLWPILVLVVLAAFWKPLREAADGVEGVESFKAGNVEITFAVGRARNLPHPSPDVANALQSLTATDRDALLSAGQPRNVAYCSAAQTIASRNTPAFRSDPRMGRLSPREIDSYAALSASYERLAELNLTHASQALPNYLPKPAWCQEQYFIAGTSDLGQRTRSYLLDLINNGIEISGSR
jgi:hypothetical protein